MFKYGLGFNILKGGGMKMAKRKKKAPKRKAVKADKNIGYWIFLVGIFIAIIAGLVTTEGVNPSVVWVLAVLGLIVGLINVTIKEEVPFLVAALVLITAAGYLAVIPFIGQTLVTILYYIVTFVAPASIVVALKAIYHFGK